MHPKLTNARPPRARRAFSLLELIAVVAIVGLLAGVAAMTFGEYATTVAAGKGVARGLALAMGVARSHAIAVGGTAAVVVTRVGGAATGFTVVTGAGALIEEPIDLPRGMDLHTTSDRWEFNHTGALTSPIAGGTLEVHDHYWIWSIDVNPVTGATQVSETID